MVPSKKKPTKETVADRESVICKVYLHEDNLYHTRFNFFLVGQGLLISALGIAWKEENAGEFTTIIIVAGLTLTFAFWYILRVLRIGIIHLGHQYEKVDLIRVYKSYNRVTDRSSLRGVSVGKLLSDGIPFGFALTWILLLLVSSSASMNLYPVKDYLVLVGSWLIVPILAFILGTRMRKTSGLGNV